MLGENLKTLRKQRGMSQEILAQQLGVVRQTVSKWEKGLSVPDAELLKRIAELFEVPTSVLLGESVSEGTEQNEVARQLAVLNEQLAQRTAKNRGLAKGILIGILTAIPVSVLVMIASFSTFSVQVETGTEAEAIEIAE